MSLYKTRFDDEPPPLPVVRVAPRSGPRFSLPAHDNREFQVVFPDGTETAWMFWPELKRAIYDVPEAAHKEGMLRWRPHLLPRPPEPRRPVANLPARPPTDEVAWPADVEPPLGG